MSGAIPPFPNTPPWRGAQLKHRDKFTFFTHFMRKTKKIRGTSKKHICWKYTEIKLILLLNVIPLDFRAPVPAFHKILIPSEKSSLVAPLANFAKRQ
jgi:hypothetical protein